MAQSEQDWSFDSDCERYERLLAQVKAGKFWTVDQPGRPSEKEFQQQVKRIQGILDQLREAEKPK